MNYDDLPGRVRDRLALSSRDEADEITRWVLLALGARLTKAGVTAGEMEDVFAQLPADYSQLFTSASGLA